MPTHSYSQHHSHTQPHPHSHPLTLPTFILTTLLSLMLLSGYWLWQGRSQPLADVAGSGHKLECVSYSPFGKDQSPLQQPVVIRPHQVDADLALLATYFSCIRTYATEGMERVPEIAARHGLTMMAGAWVSPDPVHTQAEIERLVSMANRYPDTITAAIVGNEALLRKEITGPRLAELIAQVKSRIHQPVTYADVWEFWEQYPEVAPAVDFVTIHLLPYWEDEPAGIEAAIAKVAQVREDYARKFAPKDIFIGETGWPSAGRQREAAIPSLVNEARFIREFVTLATEKGWHYNLIEAFDQPWKRANEGAVGGYWGLFDADRQDKSILAGPVSNLPQSSQWLALAAMVMGAALLLAGRPASLAAAIATPLLAGLGGICQSSWWLQASIASRDHWEWLWTLVVSLLNLAILAAAMLQLRTPQNSPGSVPCWRQQLRQRLPTPPLFLGSACVAALLCLQLLLDARYRLFTPAAILLPATCFNLRPTALPAPAARLLLALIGVSVPVILWQETLANVQALLWVGTAALMLLALLRRPQNNGEPRGIGLGVGPLLLLGLWAGVCYGIRFGLMEAKHWVATCEAGPSSGWCQLRADLGLVIHWQLLAQMALGWALLTLVLKLNGKQPGARRSAAITLVFALPALALYTTTPATLALLTGLLILALPDSSQLHRDHSGR